MSELDAEIRSSEQPMGADGRQYHIGLAPGEIAAHVLMVGDPGRARRVSERFDHIELERSSREYLSFTGVHRGLRVTVMGTGMSAANTEIGVIEMCACFPPEAVEELCVIRCGSTGSLQRHIHLGDLVISKGACRLEATTSHFVMESYPAVAHPEVVMALTEAAATAKRRFHVGITATASGFYGAQGRRIPGFPPRNPNIVDELSQQGISNLEMEASALLTLGSLRGFRAGAVCAVYATRNEGEFISGPARKEAESNCIEAGLEALHGLERMRIERAGAREWHPGMRAPSSDTGS